ncbi:DUF4238 domain-containing protein [Methylobacterium goesingense]|uniref:DUF4238 domain-containing protein n=1 Tax=Methylobacterium goesingense TaxID=243690 RepID=A0ABV2LBV3_9HYPH|nr:DUF4238 domain-containing protein [Methylobacterium goesingense]GJD73602.1 hypothetical protein CFIICLFH_1831 [Methylobacterium goesingense]
MTFPAGQHFVPEMLQKRFVDPEGMLWVYDKRVPGRGIWRSKPKGIFKERHVYTVARPDGGPSAMVERALGAVENAADPVLGRIVDRVRAGQSLNLSADERRTLLLFLYIQHKRSPEFFRSFPLDGDVEDLALSAIEVMEAESGPMPPDQRAAYLSAAGLKQVEQALRMSVLMNISPQVFGVLEARGIAVAFIPRSDRSFVLGSLPFARFMSSRGREDLGDPESELWLPIASDVAVSTYGAKGEDRVVHLVQDRPIRQVNGALVGQSSVIASGSRDLLRAVTRRLGRVTGSKG